MNLRTRLLALVCFATCLFVVSSSAQDRDHAAQYAVYGTGSFTNGHVFGYDQDRRTVQAGVSWAPPLMQRRHYTLRWRSDVIPFELVHDYRYFLPYGREWVYGGGISPVGAQMDFHNRSRVTPFGEVTGGFLYFERPILASDGTQLQFTIEAGAGIRVAMSPRTALMLGYRYHHMSNANIDHSNPGLDSQYVYLGIALMRRH